MTDLSVSSSYRSAATALLCTVCLGLSEAERQAVRHRPPEEARGAPDKGGPASDVSGSACRRLRLVHAFPVVFSRRESMRERDIRTGANLSEASDDRCADVAVF